MDPNVERFLIKCVLIVENATKVVYNGPKKRQAFFSCCLGCGGIGILKIDERETPNCGIFWRVI